MSFRGLVDLAKLRWRIERDYHDLKQEIGLGHYEGRGWQGFHHHATLSIAAYGFLISERERIPPLSTTFRRSNRKICRSQWLSTPRHPRSGRNATFPTRSPRSIACWRSRLPQPFSDASVAPAAFRGTGDGIYDAVVLAVRAPDAAPAGRADRPSWWRRTSSSGAAQPRQSPPRRDNRSFVLSNTRVHILQASVARRDRMLAACGSGDARQRRPPCQSGTPPCWQAALRSGRVTTSAAARSRRVDRARRRGMNSCQYRCPSWQWSDWICWTWLCSLDCQPLPASRRGGAGARPDHSITGSGGSQPAVFKARTRTAWSGCAFPGPQASSSASRAPARSRPPGSRRTACH